MDSNCKLFRYADIKKRILSLSQVTEIEKSPELLEDLKVSLATTKTEKSDVKAVEKQKK